MSDPNEVRRRTASRRTTTLAPDDIQTIALPGGVSITVDMIDRTVTVDADGLARDREVLDRLRERIRRDIETP